MAGQFGSIVEKKRKRNKLSVKKMFTGRVISYDLLYSNIAQIRIEKIIKEGR